MRANPIVAPARYYTGASMQRGLAIVVLCAPLAIGQRLLTLDASVTDRDGRPVAGLSAADFALTHRGVARKVESAEWSDASRGRNIIVIVDDLGLTPAR